jgi:hypothetical protein
MIVPFFLLNSFILPQLAQGQQLDEEQNNNSSTTDMLNLRNSIIPQAEQVNQANSELIKICTDSPNANCDTSMISIYNDCLAYPPFVATHIPSCGDSKLLSYLVVRGLL